jgi:DNA-binding response OmpR family regulator
VLVEGVNRVVQQPARKQEGTVGPSAGAVADTGDTVLVVDDEQLVRDLLVQFLSLRGYRALGVKEGPEAISMVEQTSPDLILLDLMLPGMNGVEVLRRLRDKHFSGAIIIVTGSYDEELLQDAWSLHPQEVITKPIDLDKLLAMIQLVLICREC